MAAAAKQLAGLCSTMPLAAPLVQKLRHAWRLGLAGRCRGRPHPWGSSEHQDHLGAHFLSEGYGLLLLLLWLLLLLLLGGQQGQELLVLLRHQGQLLRHGRQGGQLGLHVIILRPRQHHLPPGCRCCC